VLHSRSISTSSTGWLLRNRQCRASLARRTTLHRPRRTSIHRSATFTLLWFNQWKQDKRSTTRSGSTLSTKDTPTWTWQIRPVLHHRSQCHTTPSILLTPRHPRKSTINTHRSANRTWANSMSTIRPISTNSLPIPCSLTTLLFYRLASFRSSLNIIRFRSSVSIHIACITTIQRCTSIGRRPRHKLCIFSGLALFYSLSTCSSKLFLTLFFGAFIPSIHTQRTPSPGTDTITECVRSAQLTFFFPSLGTTLVWWRPSVYSYLYIVTKRCYFLRTFSFFFWIHTSNMICVTYWRCSEILILVYNLPFLPDKKVDQKGTFSNILDRAPYVFRVRLF